MLVDKHPQLGLFPGCFRCWFCIQLESFVQSLAAIRSSTRLRSNALVLAAAFFEGKTVGASWSCEIQNLVGLYAEHWTCEVIRTQGAGKKTKGGRAAKPQLCRQCDPVGRPQSPASSCKESEHTSRHEQNPSQTLVSGETGANEQAASG